MDSIGKRVTYAIEHSPLSPAEVARRIGITKQAISAIMLDKTKNPKPINLLHIGKVTGYRLEWLITGQGPQTVQEAAEGIIDIADLSPDSQAAIRAVVHSLAHKKPERNHS